MKVSDFISELVAWRPTPQPQVQTPMDTPEWEKKGSFGSLFFFKFFSVSQRTSNADDDDKHDQLEEVDYNKQDDETKPEGVYTRYNPAAVESEKEKC